MPTLFTSGVRRSSLAYAGSYGGRAVERSPLSRALMIVALLLAVCLLAIVIGAATAQAQTHNELSDYTAAVAHPDRIDRLSALEAYVRAAAPGPLKTEALTFLTWEYWQSGDQSRAVRWAQQLQAADVDNPFAMALVSDAARNTSPSDKGGAQQMLADATRGLSSFGRMQRPLGMPLADFSRLQLTAQAMLKGAAGWAELQRKNYPGARNDLRDALALQPDVPKNVYAMAIAYLEGKDANPKEGYWYLARAVNLSRGTPEEAKVAQFARERYMKDGGTSAAWDQFLAAARVPGQAAPQTELATARPSVAPLANAKPAQSATTVARSPVPPVTAEPRKATKSESIWADDTPVNPVPHKRPVASSAGPASIGILIETSLTSKDNRSDLTNALSDMVRHMAESDEAFILTYDNNLVFEEDLTGDPNQLEQALDRIKPQKGAVLDDAVAFAAGHLARIAKNPRRELLVISDGRNVDSQSSPIRTSAQINAAGVKIYCIGVGVDEIGGRYRLQALSSSTGGRSDFISSPEQLRRATIEIAQNMGIDFRF